MGVESDATAPHAGSRLKAAHGAGQWRWLGRSAFGPLHNRQEALRKSVQAGNAVEQLLFCEHPPVITLGRSAKREDILASPETLVHRGVEVVSATRGGAATYHGPGQLVGYPIFRLRRGIVAHVAGVCEAVCVVLAQFQIEAKYRRDNPGVWVDNAKICAVGVHVNRGVTIHGFALNAAPDLKNFSLIVPCGQPSAAVTSMAQLGITEATDPAFLKNLAGRLAPVMGAIAGLDLVYADDEPNEESAT